jgi:hypothetical protein
MDCLTMTLDLKSEAVPVSGPEEIEALVRKAIDAVRRGETVLLRPEPRPPKPPAAS